MKALKVFRTPIGFHDAYVAAPSQKAALAAWGADANLFARGVAELVTDPALTREPLASPGKVIRKLRGSEAEHLAALPKETRSARAKAPAAKADPPKKQPKPRPRPARTSLDRAEAKLDELESAQEAERAVLDEEIAALMRDRKALEAAHEKARAALERKRAAAEQAYERKMDAWRRG